MRGTGAGCAAVTRPSFMIPIPDGRPAVGREHIGMSLKALTYSEDVGIVALFHAAERTIGP